MLRFEISDDIYYDMFPQMELELLREAALISMEEKQQQQQVYNLYCKDCRCRCLNSNMMFLKLAPNFVELGSSAGPKLPYLFEKLNTKLSYFTG